MNETPPQNFIRAIIAEDLKSRKHGGRVATRFPPEPNGYLHIGHAKSICLNFSIAQDIPGAVCHLRFDDTNPLKEETEFVESIQQDVRWLGFDWGDNLYFASDYFERLYEFAVELIRAGKAYVCSLTEEQVKEYRGSINQPGKPSPDRDRPIQENLDLFARMRAGEFQDGELVLRAKIDMAASNMKLRDPAIYRIRHTHHHRTGDTWCIYPLYDFTHCLSDSIEHITHSLCTLEFESARALYDWVLDNLDVPSRPRQYEFAKFGLSYTVLSKRNLRALVEEGHVSGWDDPRMPTISGLRRRGCTPQAIVNLCERVGVAKSENTVELSLLEHCVREDLNPVVPRVLAVLDPLKVVITNYPADKQELIQASSYPDDVPKSGSRALPFSRELYIDADDFMEHPPAKYHRLAPGREVRLRHAYVLRCDEVKKDNSGNVTELLCSYDPDTLDGQPKDGRKVKGTIHWVSTQHALPIEARLYERLFNVEDPNVPERDFRDCINSDSLVVKQGYIEPSVADAASETRYQFERLGFFWQDPKDSKPDQLVFNRIVSLKDSWSKIVETQSGGKSEVQARQEDRRRQREAQKAKQAANQRTAEIELNERGARYHQQGIPKQQAAVLSSSEELAEFYERASQHAEPKNVANWVVTELARELKERSVSELRFGPEQLAALVTLVDSGEISARAGKEVFAELISSGGQPAEIVQRLGLQQITDVSALQSMIDEVLTALPEKVNAYRSGNANLLGLFVGQVMKQSQGKADPKLLNQLLKKRLDN